MSWLSQGLYVGFAFFKASSSQQGLANQMFGVFMLMTVFGTLMEQSELRLRGSVELEWLPRHLAKFSALCRQVVESSPPSVIPNFVLQRTLYEARERPAKTYSWKVFMLASMVVEIPFNALAALILFVTVYYPIGLYRNAQVAGQMHERGFLFFFLLQIFLLYVRLNPNRSAAHLSDLFYSSLPTFASLQTSTFASFVIAGIESVETASNLGNLILYLSLIFCGYV